MPRVKSESDSESDDKLILGGQAGYTHKELYTLAGYVCDALFAEGYKDFDPVKTALVLARFKLTQAGWDLGREDLKDLAHFMAMCYLHEFVDVKKGILR